MLFRSVVDLTQTLRPETPAIGFAPLPASPNPFRISEISRYDQRGPAWYWNNISMGEHTGTHFDAPVHLPAGSRVTATGRYRAGQGTRTPRQTFNLWIDFAE